MSWLLYPVRRKWLFLIGIILLAAVPAFAFAGGHFVAAHILAVNLGNGAVARDTALSAGTWIVFAEMIDLIACIMLLFGKGMARITLILIALIFAFVIPEMI